MGTVCRYDMGDLEMPLFSHMLSIMFTKDAQRSHSEYDFKQAEKK